MDQIKDILENIPQSEGGPSVDEIMADPEYLRHSSDIISEALQKGFDVLQLENGDIVTTGTKVVVNQYRWDAEEQKMVKLTAKERKALEKKQKDQTK